MCATHKEEVNHTLKRLTTLLKQHLLKKDRGIGISRRYVVEKHRFRIRYLISIHPNLGEIAEQLNYCNIGYRVGSLYPGSCAARRSSSCPFKASTHKFLWVHKSRRGEKNA